MNSGDSSAQLSLWRDGPSAAQDWTLRESARSRRLSVRVHQGGRVEVVVPRGTARPTVIAFLQRHSQWIDRRREQAQRLARPVEPFPPVSLRLTAIEQHWRVHLAGGDGTWRIHAMPGGVLAIGGGGSPAALRAALQRWLYVQARAQLGLRLQQLAAATGHEFARVQIRRQRSRWGSCSATGTISLNCALLFQRPEVLRYLLVHELVHTRHMNHSRRYWAAVAQLEPGYRQLDRELLAGWTRVPAWLFAAPEEGP
jgi:predicted metal-dependent hydrolase